MLSNLKTFVDKELVTYHAANDKFPKVAAEADIKKFTDVKEVKMKTATNATGVTVYNFKAGADDACIEITTNDSAGTVTIKPNKSTANKGCQVALVAAVKNEYLNGTVDKDGKVTNIENETVVSAVGGDSGRYDTSGAFGGTTKP